MATAAPWFHRARLKLRQLQLLVALDEAGNIHRAALALHLTQPAASKLLKEVETALGVPLFERLPRGMRATPCGEVLVRHARLALASLTQAHDEVQALKTGRFGHVRVGCIAAPGMTLLPAAVTLAKRQNPGLRVAVSVDSSDQLLERLGQGRLDIVVGRLFERHAKADLRYEALVDEPVSAIARPGHPLLARLRLTLADVARAPWIVPPEGSVLRHRFELMFREAGLLPPDDLIETTAPTFTTRMLQGSDLLAVVASDLARHFADHGMVALLPLALPCPMDAFGLITRTDRLPTPAARVMLRALQAAALTVYGKSLDLAEAA